MKVGKLVLQVLRQRHVCGPTGGVGRDAMRNGSLEARGSFSRGSRRASMSEKRQARAKRWTAGSKAWRSEKREASAVGAVRGRDGEEKRSRRWEEQRQEWDAAQEIKSYFYLLYFSISGGPTLELLTSFSFTPSATNASAFLFSIYFGATKNLATRKRRSTARLGEEEKTFWKSQTMESLVSLEMLLRASSDDSSSLKRIDCWISSMMEARDQTALPTEPRSGEGGRGRGEFIHFFLNWTRRREKGMSVAGLLSWKLKSKGGLTGEGDQGGTGREDGPWGLRAADLLLGSSAMDGGAKGLDGFVDKEESREEMRHQNFLRQN